MNRNSKRAGQTSVRASSHWLRGVAATTLMSFLITSCGGKATTPTPPGGQLGSASPLSDLALVQLKDAPPGLDLRVSEGKLGAPALDTSKLPPAKKLTAQEAEALLARSRPIQTDPDDQKAFALRPGSQPAPRTGNTIKAAFPAPPSSLLPPAANEAGKELKVLRWMPEGAVPLAPELSLTFSQPMTAVTSQDDAASVVPVKLSPQPKGKWRWIGTRTILFDPEVRFPQATTYTVEVPAGTKSSLNNALKAPHKFTFETPPPSLTTRYPSGGPQRLDVPMLLAFDQKIDAQVVFVMLKVTANSTPVKIELLDRAAIDKDKNLKPLAASLDKSDQQGRWFAFHAVSEFPKDAQISIEVPVGTPSAEGPNKTTKTQTHAFRTYPPLKILREGCGYQGKCPPGTPFTITFNNPLDADKFAAEQVATTPDVPGYKVVQSGTSISLMGNTKAHTTYGVRVSGGILDEFGQTLGPDAPLTWKVTDALPTFFGPQGMVVLDPAAKAPTLDFFTTNYEQLKVRLYQVDTGDFDRYGLAMRNQWNKDKPPAWPGRKVFDQLVKTAPSKDMLVETHVDLKAALDRTGLGHAIAVVEPYPWTEKYDPPRLISWVQSTKLAVDAYVDADQLIAFVTDLGTGKPASGVALEIRPHGIKGATNEQGMATLALPAVAKQVKGAHYLVAKRGNDTAFIGDQNGYWNEYGSWNKQERPTTLAWYVIDDRKMYKPGEEVTLTGWLRTMQYGKGGDVGGINGAVQAITYKVSDSRGNEIGKGSMPVSAVGGFATKFTLPKTPNLGYAYVRLEATGRMTGSYSHNFQIQEFRRPEFQVSAQQSQGPFLIGGSGDVTVNASYFAGGPLGGAPVNWYVTASETSFTPPNRDDFTFGTWSPWWGRVSYDGDSDDEDGLGYKPPKTWNLAGKTDASGAHVLHLDFLSANPAVPMSVSANASVTDVNRQTWSAASALLVHPSQAYVGLRTKKSFVEKGQPFEIDVIGVGIDGAAKPGAKIEVKAVRLDFEYKKGKYVTKEVDPQTCGVVAAKDPVPCSFATKEGGTYKITALIVDERGRPNQTTLTFWVTGGDQPPSREVAQEKVQIIPDKKEYAPGNVAELLLQAPFYPAEAVLSWRRSGIVKTERIAITGPTKVITVPISDAMTPNMFVQVDLVGMAARLDDKGDPDPKLPKRPAYAVGSIDLPVPPKHRTLAVTVTPNAAKLGPGEAAKLGVIVKDAQGRPVAGADATVLVVDEAVLSLTGYQFPNPINTFYGHRGSDARDYYLRSHVKLARPQGDLTADRDADGILDGEDMNSEGDVTTTISGRVSRPYGGMAGRSRGGKALEEKKESPAKNKQKPADSRDDDEREEGGESQPDPAIAVRANFNPLAAFAPSVKTDANGAATVDLKLPDNLTRYRVVAIATAGDKQFGKGENNLTARLPLMVRPSPPRFLNFGDTFELPVVLQNQTDAAMTVRVAVRAANAAITDGAGRELVVPANERLEVRFPAAAQLAGTARFQLVASSGKYSDASELALPVWTPATTEAFATYGVIDNGATAQPVALPGKVVTEFGGLEVTTASTNLQALTDAMLYLVKYPYECAEQRASRVMAIAALRDVLTAFKTKDLPSQAALEASVKTDLERLSQMQNYDGGFTFWERGHPSEPYLTVYVANALQRAKAKGFTGTDEMINRAKPYLKNIERYYPWYYTKDIRFSISSYAVYTRKLLGDPDLSKGQKLLRDYGAIDKAPMEALGWLLGAFAQQKGVEAERKQLVRHAMNKVSETAGAANFTTSYGDGAYLMLASDRRVDSVMLESLIQEQKDLDLIPKIVTGLLAHRKRGRWLNTQENTFALLAMDRYFQTYEKTTPDFVARVWLGNDYAGDHAFKGRSTDYFAISIPMKDVATHDKQALTIQKDGAGRLYYRIGMNYAPANLKLEPADYGFVVTRTYEAVDDPKHVWRTPDGVWHVKAGARVRVKLNMVNENRRYHVALVDPMPAGFEPMNPALAVTGPIPVDPNQQKARGAYWWWYGPWYEHQNMRDERVEAFASLLWEGVHTYEYVARATTPGNFVVPPPKAEEMYMPETFGRGGSDRLVIE